MSPDTRPSHQPRSENERFFIDRPRRKRGVSNPQLGKWFNLVDSDWPRLVRTAYASLDQQPDAILRPNLLTAASAGDKFRFRRSDIGLHIVTIGVPGFVRNVFNNYEIGTELDPDNKGTGHPERVYEVTRSELFQVFVTVLARLEIPGKTKLQKSRIKNMKRVREKLRPSEDILKLRREIDRVKLQDEDLQKQIPELKGEPQIHIMERPKVEIEYRKRPPIIDPFTKEEVDRLMRERPERGGPMMNVR